MMTRLPPPRAHSDRRLLHLDGPGSGATAAARGEERTPRMHKFTNGCAKQYKGNRNFFFLADSVWKIWLHRGAPFLRRPLISKAAAIVIDGVAKNAVK